MQLGICGRTKSCLHSFSISTEPVCVCAQLFQWCPTLCKPMDRSPPGSSVHGILRARILEWVAMLSSRDFSQPRDQTYISCVSCLAEGFFIPRTAQEAHHRANHGARWVLSRKFGIVSDFLVCTIEKR